MSIKEIIINSTNDSEHNYIDIYKGGLYEGDECLDIASSAIQEEIKKVIGEVTKYAIQVYDPKTIKGGGDSGMVLVTGIKLSDLELAINKRFGDGKC